MKKLVKTIRQYDIYCDSCGCKLENAVRIKQTRYHKGEDIYQDFEVCETCAKDIGRAIKNGPGEYNQISYNMLHSKQEIDTVEKYEFTLPYNVKDYCEYEYYTEPVKIK